MTGQPYYEGDGVTIYHGDARAILPHLEAEALITDPVWPNCEHVFPGIDAERLLADVLAVARVRRIVVQLGCASDVRILRAVPARFPFVRVCWLEYACPSYQGRILNTGDVAYVFGEPPAPRPGAMVLPGRCIATRTKADEWREIAHRRAIRLGKERGGRPGPSDHPTPRRLEHVAWLVKWFGGDSVVDPFCGSGTTLVAAKRMGVRACGIDSNEDYCGIAIRRLAQGVLTAMYEGADDTTVSAGV